MQLTAPRNVEDFISDAQNKVLGSISGNWVQAIDTYSTHQLQNPSLFSEAGTAQCRFWRWAAEAANREFALGQRPRGLVRSTGRLVRQYVSLHAHPARGEKISWLLNRRVIDVPGTTIETEVTKFGHIYVQAFVRATQPVLH